MAVTATTKKIRHQCVSCNIRPGNMAKYAVYYEILYTVIYDLEDMIHVNRYDVMVCMLYHKTPPPENSNMLHFFMGCMFL